LQGHSRSEYKRSYFSHEREGVCRFEEVVGGDEVEVVDRAAVIERVVAETINLPAEEDLMFGVRTQLEN
jgi:hypothetical protein